MAKRGKNKSKFYGYYGGVTNENHYTPPEVPAFVPQPKTVPFYAEYIQLLDEALSSVNFSLEYLLLSADKILIRKELSSTDTTKTFEMRNFANPNDIILYTTPISGTVDLVTLDGGLF